MFTKKRYSSIVIVWLFIGILMVFIQVIVGGITRLTESGLSITEWNVVEGTIPPFSHEAWLEEFEKYKDTPQYSEINEGITLAEFKFIYFWEFVHRFWARLIGFVFIIPFVYFLVTKKIDRDLIKRLGIIVGLGLLAAVFGWIMVASGLINRPWVNAYKLSIHLSIAFAVYGCLWYTFIYAINFKIAKPVNIDSNVYRSTYLIFIIYCIQVVLGGILSGMKAAVIFPTWPYINNEFIPSVLLNLDNWSIDNFTNYDSNIFMPSFIHFFHRLTAYLLCIVAYYIGYKFIIKNKYVEDTFTKNVLLWIGYAYILVVSIQALLGIVTVMNSTGSIPILWGVLHQGFALILLSLILLTIFILKLNNRIK